LSDLSPLQLTLTAATNLRQSGPWSFLGQRPLLQCCGRSKI